MLEWRVDRHPTFTVDYAHCFGGDFLKRTTPGKDADFFSVWATYRFWGAKVVGKVPAKMPATSPWMSFSRFVGEEWLSTRRLDETPESAHFTGGFVACHATGLWLRELGLNGMSVPKARYLSDSDPRIHIEMVDRVEVRKSGWSSAYEIVHEIG